MIPFLQYLPYKGSVESRTPQLFCTKVSFTFRREPKSSDDHENSDDDEEEEDL